MAENPANPRRRAAWRAIFVGLAGLFGCFAPGLLDMNMMGGGFALIFVGGFVTLVSLIVAGMFFRSAAVLGRILAGQGRLATWTYPPDQWRRFVDIEEGISAAESRALFRLVLIITLVVGVGFLAVVRDQAGVVVFGVLMGLLIVIGVVSRLAPRIRARRYRQFSGPVLVAESGIFFAGYFHDFRFGQGRLEGAELISAQELVLLVVQYSYQARQGRENVTVRLPVPWDRLNEAQQVASRLSTLAKGGADSSGQ